MSQVDTELSNETKKIYPYEFDDLINSGKFIRTIIITSYHYGRDDTRYEETFAVEKFYDLLKYLRKGEWSIYLDEFSDREINEAFESGKDLETKRGSGYGIRFGKIPLL
jgi:hypothetical protein